MLRHLERTVPEDPRRPAPADEDAAPHPMRTVTRQVAFEVDGWTDARRAKVAALFDGMAADWHRHAEDPQRTAALEDAYDRGAIPAGGTCLEVGSGDGANTDFLGRHHDAVLALDLSWEMLVRGRATRLQGDSSRTPLRAGSIDVVVLVNALLFPVETDRVLAPGGVVVWVNTAGSRTPIHLTADEVEEALPGAWDGLASEAGPGTWSVWRRLAP